MKFLCNFKYFNIRYKKHFIIYLNFKIKIEFKLDLNNKALNFKILKVK